MDGICRLNNIIFYRLNIDLCVAMNMRLFAAQIGLFIHRLLRNLWIRHVTVCLLTRPIRLTNMDPAVRYPVVFFVAFITQTFVFATKPKGNIASARIVCEKFDMTAACRLDMY